MAQNTGYTKALRQHETDWEGDLAERVGFEPTVRY